MRRRRTRPRPDRPAGFEQWRPDRYEIAAPCDQIEAVDGFTYGGLGLHRTSFVRARYVRKNGTRKIFETWSVTHLNTGHAVRSLTDPLDALERTPGRTPAFERPSRLQEIIRAAAEAPQQFGAMPAPFTAGEQLGLFA